MKHRQRHQKKSPNSDNWWFQTECGKILPPKDVVASDMKTECPECLRGILMKREEEIEILKRKLEQSL